MITNKNLKTAVPAYLDELYSNYDKCEAKDGKFSCNLRSFYQYSKLVESLTKEIKQSQSVLQLGVVFGKEIDEVAMSVGPYGRYDVIDISRTQIDRVTEKYSKVYPALQFYKKDAANFKMEIEDYDVVICFMLLSEVPIATKTKIINKALQKVRSGGKVVFIDYHNPLPYHPLGWIVKTYNRLYKPFVEKLWDRQIDAYADPKLRRQFVWRKTTFFGRLYQKMVAIKKD